MSIQTRKAQRLVTGRRANGEQKEIIGLMRFAAMLGPITAGARGDDPYADWWLLHVEQELNQSREWIGDYRTQVDKSLSSVPAFDVQIAESLEPARVDLTFHSPYAFMGAYLLADYDALVRAIFTARHIALLERDDAERMIAEGGRAVRRAYDAACGYRFLAVTRDDLRQNTAKAQRARKLLGSLPQEVLDGVLRAAHAPEVSALKDDARSTAAASEDDDDLDGEASEILSHSGDDAVGFADVPGRARR